MEDNTVMLEECQMEIKYFFRFRRGQKRNHEKQCGKSYPQISQMRRKKKQRVCLNL
jgi:hypothetical protein